MTGSNNNTSGGNVTFSGGMNRYPAGTRYRHGSRWYEIVEVSGDSFRYKYDESGNSIYHLFSNSILNMPDYDVEIVLPKSEEFKTFYDRLK